MEHYRSEGKYQQMDDTPQEIPEKVLDLEGHGGVQAVLRAGAEDPVGAAGAGQWAAAGGFF